MQHFLHGGEWNFYPRPPRGGRLNCICSNPRSLKFLSTPSARRATCDATLGKGYEVFLSTPSARRATRGGQERALAILNFYPRPPRGGRRQESFSNAG